MPSQADLCASKVGFTPDDGPDSERRYTGAFDPRPTWPNLLLWNEIGLLVLMKEQNAVHKSDASVAVHRHSRLKHIGAGGKLSPLALLEGVTPSPRQIYAVIVAGVGVSWCDKPGGQLEKPPELARTRVPPKGYDFHR